ncbi:FAD/NAD(P)-binding domain-containing protein [Daedalea quercina L-15889]|uniref:FAD/NAD(P)-binding domain-containing protein n=1 Tax=Daedalea quercina L-15889 TaxID=1314783 RepID=A0A165MCT6_9APHY|nr:FAD/NAD(P)-binding domain-containing protein [Daedalea quercina L-15889]
MSAVVAEQRNVSQFVHNTLLAARTGDLRTLFSPARVIRSLFAAFYILIELVIISLFKPPVPPRNFKSRARIAVVGAGLTGVSTAAHAIAHGFDVVIYDQNESVGGIWSHVNATSGLQLNSLLYRFHPAVLWSCAFPQRNEILSEIRRVWKEYRLEEHTHLCTRVTSIRRATREEITDVPEDDIDPCQQGHARWIVNDGVDGVFDAVVVTVGTCGEPQWVKFAGMPVMEEVRARRARIQEEASENSQEKGEDKDDSKTDSDADGDSEGRKLSQKTADEGTGDDNQDGETFAGTLLHSSELDDAHLAGKHVVVIGSGASGVEAVETALARGAMDAVMLARQDKWIIPRNIVIDTLVSAQPFGREMPLSFIWEKLITLWNYHGVEDLTPAHLGLFQGTPVVNDEFLEHVRAGRCKYVRGDTQGLTRGGVKISVRGRDSKPGDDGKEEVVGAAQFPADVVVLATGFKKPDIGFLPEDLFPESYERPNLYLQNFATEDWSVLMTNSAYVNAIGTVGHFHIGIYIRILLTFLMDRDARPTPKDMKLWVDVLRFVKRGARGGALGFFTYMELTIWFLLFHLFRLDRLKWMFFIMQGWGVPPEPAEMTEEGSDVHTVKEGRAPISANGLVRDWVKGN